MTDAEAGQGGQQDQAGRGNIGCNEAAQVVGEARMTDLPESLVGFGFMSVCKKD